MDENVTNTEENVKKSQEIYISVKKNVIIVFVYIQRE